MATKATARRIIDGDGHVLEDTNAIRSKLPEAIQRSNLVKVAGPFPQLDNLHTGAWTSPPGSFANPGLSGWQEFLEVTNFESAVVYPTHGLGFCRTVDPDLAVLVARAYNDWLYETYLKPEPRIKGVALLPMQDPDAAVEELRRAVTELGMPAAMLPPSGLPHLLGSKEYWPVYEEANRLGCTLGLHGGAHQDMGMNFMQVFAATHALGHPFSQAIQFCDLVVNRAFDRFPNVRWGFMEAGLGWLLMVLERLPGSYKAFIPINPTGRFLDLPEKGMFRYLMDHFEAGRIFVGVEGDEPNLSYAVKTYGEKPWVFSSDYPHEVNKDTIAEEIDELEDDESVSESAKKAIFATNAERLYGLS